MKLTRSGLMPPGDSTPRSKPKLTLYVKMSPNVAIFLGWQIFKRTISLPNFYKNYIPRKKLYTTVSKGFVLYHLNMPQFFIAIIYVYCWRKEDIFFDEISSYCAKRFLTKMRRRCSGRTNERKRIFAQNIFQFLQMEFFITKIFKPNFQNCRCTLVSTRNESLTNTILPRGEESQHLKHLQQKPHHRGRQPQRAGDGLAGRIRPRDAPGQGPA